MRGTSPLDHLNRSWGTGDVANYPDVEDASVFLTQMKKHRIKSINWLGKENRTSIEKFDEVDDYRGEDKLNKGADEEEMLRI